MKKLFYLTIAALMMGACQGTADPEQENQKDNTSDLEGAITLYAEKGVIKADGVYSSKLTVILLDRRGEEHDVTDDVEIYCEGNDAPLSGSDFKTETEGEYVLYAMRGFDISNSVTVRAVNGVPELPADQDAANTAFAHRMLLLQHTGSECPNCPALMDILKRLSENDAYKDLYYHVASHSYNESDAAYSSAAQTLSKAMNLTGNYPMVTYNLTTENGFFEENIKETLLSLSKESAEAGIAASSVVDGDKVRVNINIKSAVDSKYRVAVWVLEDNIHSPQSGATASWHNMHSNCLRYMYGDEKTECIYGKNLGLVKAGESKDIIAAFNLDQEWVKENCKLMIIAVSANDDYHLANCTNCPIEGTVSYDYL
ncbi:MAG: Omp28-related outer membrane protein [Bacteroidales bacterium]|nr:Omp28-related outer membrane protein [Bacteroidales bacterium]MBO5980005.1 Omp28-related outer membrane protein [Bacteroidales bacterium]